MKSELANRIVVEKSIATNLRPSSSTRITLSALIFEVDRLRNLGIPTDATISFVGNGFTVAWREYA